MSDNSEQNNAVVHKSMQFAIQCVIAYKHLTDSQKEYVLSKQLLRSGTSIGANVKEAIRAQSRADFGAKMNISLKEASETEYWIDLLHTTGYLPEANYQALIFPCKELIRLLTAIVKTTFSKKS